MSAPIGIVVAHIKNQNVSTRYDLARGDDADFAETSCALHDRSSLIEATDDGSPLQVSG
ncbi:MAG: hypothetical protein WAK03_11295 [Methylocystis sp.]